MILFKKLFRTIGKYKAQFISMILMIALGVGVFLGFNIEWHSIEKSANKYFSEANYPEYKLVLATGFSEDDLLNIKNIEGVEDATRSLTIKVSLKDKDANLSLNTFDKYGISKFTVISGIDYDLSTNGIWLSDKFAEENGYKLGDEISLKYADTSASLKIVGLIKSAEYMVCIDDNQLMPKYSDYGFCYTNPETVKNQLKIVNNENVAYFNQILIKSNLSKSDFKTKVNTALGKETLLLSLEESTSYQSVKSESEEGKTMGSIIPVLFLIIAILTMVTTMSRISKSEKTQIGTLKALGFKDKTILFHYTAFGLIVGIIGSILGILLGFLVARIILSPTGMMSTYFDWSEWHLSMPWFCPAIIILIILMMTLVSFVTVNKFLKMSPAETLRPYTPKKIKQTKLEKTKLWNKLSFGVRWNYRDIIRNISRSIVTLIGVTGCVLLIVASFGMSNSMDGFLNILNSSMNYKTKINLSDFSTKEQIETLKVKYNAEETSSFSVKLNDKPIVLEIYSEDSTMSAFYNPNAKKIKLSSDGIYICERIHKTGINVGDTITFSPYGTSKTYSAKVVGINKSMISENITMTSKFADSIGLEYQATALFTNTELKNIESNSIITSVQDKDTLMSSYESFLQIMNSSITILVVAALCLALIVLYNLGVMGYTERYRELATLKVVGFKDKQISKLLVGQNTFLTIVGTIIGLPLGYGVLKWMMTALASEYELKVQVYFSSYLIAILLTMAISVIVGLLISNKNKKINMAEALKDKE